MRIMLTVLFIALQVLDVWSTRSILARGGRERNPVMRALMRVCGRWWWVPKLGFAIPCGVYLGFVDGWEGPALLVCATSSIFGWCGIICASSRRGAAP